MVDLRRRRPRAELGAPAEAVVRPGDCGVLMHLWCKADAVNVVLAMQVRPHMHAFPAMHSVQWHREQFAMSFQWYMLASGFVHAVVFRARSAVSSS